MAKNGEDEPLVLIITWVLVAIFCGVAFLMVRRVINKRIRNEDLTAYQFVYNQIYIYVASDSCMLIQAILWWIGYLIGDSNKAASNAFKLVSYLFFAGSICFFVIGMWLFSFKNWVISREMPEYLLLTGIIQEKPKKCFENLEEKHYKCINRSMVSFIVIGWTIYLIVSAQFVLDDSLGLLYALNLVMIVLIMLPPVFLLGRALQHIIKTTKLSPVALNSDIKVMVLHFTSMFITFGLSLGQVIVAIKIFILQKHGDVNKKDYHSLDNAVLVLQYLEMIGFFGIQTIFMYFFLNYGKKKQPSEQEDSFKTDSVLDQRQSVTDGQFNIRDISAGSIVTLDEEDEQLMPQIDDDSDFQLKQINKFNRLTTDLSESKAELISINELKLRGAIFSNFITRDSIGDMFVNQNRISHAGDEATRNLKINTLRDSLFKNTLANSRRQQGRNFSGKTKAAQEGFSTYVNETLDDN